MCNMQMFVSTILAKSSWDTWAVSHTCISLVGRKYILGSVAWWQSPIFSPIFHLFRTVSWKWFWKLVFSGFAYLILQGFCLRLEAKCYVRMFTLSCTLMPYNDVWRHPRTKHDSKHLDATLLSFWLTAFHLF